MADNEVSLHWTGEADVFRGSRDGGPSISIDSDGVDGPSPMDSLLLSVAACMCIDIRMILGKSRVPLESLEARVEGDRAPEPPRRYTRIHMTFLISGPAPEDDGKVERAVALSRDTYCSVLHSLRQDIPVELEIRKI